MSRGRQQRQDGWDDFGLQDEFNSNSYENSISSYPQADLNTSGTFKLRTDPSELLESYRLQLMNAYKVEKEVKQEDGTTKKIIKIKFKKNTRPRANKQGVEDIISYVQKFINNHSVQGNIPDMNEFRNFLRSVSNNLTMHFHTKREEWGILKSDIDSIISNAIDLVHMFLTRPLDNEERKLYGETYKESTSREIRPEQRQNLFQKLGGFLTGGGRKNG